MNYDRIIKNPLRRRRVKNGLSQKDVSKHLGITQSQYSRLENSESDPTKYLSALSKVLNCKPNEIFGAEILREIEEEFLNLPETKGAGFVVHEKKPEYVFLQWEGWFQIKNVENTLKNIRQIDKGYKDHVKNTRTIKPRIKLR